MTATDARLAFKQTAFHEIPVIDIAPLIDGTDPESVARQIGKVCEEVGFLYVKNHGVPAEQIAEMYRVTEQFFALPMATKESVHIATTGDVLRGYIPTELTTKPWPSGSGKVPRLRRAGWKTICRSGRAAAGPLRMKAVDSNTLLASGPPRPKTYCARFSAARGSVRSDSP